MFENNYLILTIENVLKLLGDSQHYYVQESFSKDKLYIFLRVIKL